MGPTLTGTGVVAKYIDGIFNYCDRWCERCPFTTRCRSFAMGRAIERDLRRKEQENAAFWDAMDKACGDALTELTRQHDALPTGREAKPEDARAGGDEFDDDVDDVIDDREDKAAFGRKIEREEKAARAHPLSRQAEEYLWAAHRWLERRRERVPDEIADAFDVIAWYHMFISAKLQRAVSGLIEQEDEQRVDEEGVPYPKDSDGSAKIAVIAIERSFAAWSLVRDRLEKEGKTAAKMMGMLLRLRAAAERYFPDARKFHRPGFDDHGSRD
jgi:hypothetical protein